MTITFTMAEVRTILRQAVRANLNKILPEDAPVRFIHRYADGSGEIEVEMVCPITRVEIEVEPKEDA